MANNQSSPSTERLGELILVRLLAAGKLSRFDLDRALCRYFANSKGKPADAWRSALPEVLTTLQAEKWIERDTLQLTAQGRARALNFLSIKSPPARATWQTLRNRYLVAKVLGITPRSKAEWERLGTAEGLRAAILTKHYNLPLAPVPNSAQALNALAWAQLKQHYAIDVPWERPFTRKAVLGVALLGGRSSKQSEDALLAARAIGAANSRPDALRDALISAWVQGERPSDVEPPRPSPVESPRFDLQAFAAKVCQLACNTSTGRFGDHKVFISHVWDRFHQENGTNGMTREEFNRRLVEANRYELLTLTRADLLSAMAPEDVRLSEITLPHATFHFIRTDHQSGGRC